MILKKFKNQTEADAYFMTQANSERLNTDDPKGKVMLQSAVGAIITKKDTELARSANVLPPKLKKIFKNKDRPISEEDRYYVIEHAERSVIFKAYSSKQDLTGATIYCTRFPCSDCARAIVWSGITRAVFSGGFASENRWLASQRAALKILRDGGVVVRYLSSRHVFSASEN